MSDMPRYTPQQLGQTAGDKARALTAADLADFTRAAARVGEGYSLRNRFLMWIQDPKVSQVAGFRAWRQQNRRVRKGARGLAILAPITRPSTDDQSDRQSGHEPDGAAEGPRVAGDRPRRIASCKVIYVFDISQTEPLIPCPRCGQSCTCPSPAPNVAGTPASGEVTAMLDALAATNDDGDEQP
ncbi:ArdC family protein [Actinomadura sp. 3N407]|uniref:ArdC family protein n=1 Tax=Actinomadura sp. 3N407 TaxID=3457423 RepID=UPI003FCE1BF4